MIYKIQLAKQIKKSGRTRQWLHDQMNMPRSTFWWKVRHDTLTKEEKREINNLLSK